jgi:hypothetical protein
LKFFTLDFLLSKKSNNIKLCQKAPQNKINRKEAYETYLLFLPPFVDAFILWSSLLVLNIIEIIFIERLELE